MRPAPRSSRSIGLTWYLAGRASFNAFTYTLDLLIPIGAFGLRARPETVWRYWTDPERICAWWGSSAELDPRPGGICLVRLGGDAVMRGEFAELIPYRRIVFTLGWEPADGAPPVAPGSTTVTITLTEDDGETILTLRHTGLPPAARDLHRAGWSHFLPMLASAARRPGAQVREER